MFLAITPVLAGDQPETPGYELSNWNFFKNGGVKLKDGWTVYRDAIIDPSFFERGHCQPNNQELLFKRETVSAPDLWGPAFTKTIKTGHGKATYCMELALPDDGQLHSIRMGTMRSVSVIYAVYERDDGETDSILLHKNGDPNLSKYESINNPGIPVVDLPYGTRHLAYVVQVSNTIHKQGGMVEIPVVDLKWQLEAEENKSTSLPGALSILLLMVAIGAFIVGLRYQSAVGHNIFACLTLAAAVRVIFVSDLIWDFFPAFPLSVKYDLEYLSLFLIGAAYYAFICYIFGEKMEKLGYIIYGVVGSMTFYVIFIAPFMPPGTVTLIREAMQVFWVVLGIGVAWTIIRSLSTHPEKSKEALVVIAAALATAVYEIISVTGVVEWSLEWSQFIVVFVLIMHTRAFVINSRRIEQERDDLTARLQESNEDLKNRAVALDLALMRAEESSKAKSEFLANVSHELRTPLNAIIGFSDLISRQLFGPVGDKKYLDYVADIHESGKHLQELVNDILDLSRIEANADPLKEQTFNVQSVITAAIRLLKGQADKRGITIAVSVKPGTKLLYADERKVKQILLNLIGNGIKFNRDGGNVSVTAWSDKTGHFIRVIDTGIGIEESEIPVTLTRFGQVGSPMNRKYGGVGIGLPLSLAIAQQHGGDLKIESVYGEGTTVTLKFPVERCRDKEEEA